MTTRLLLVDDELHILRAAEFKFKRQGYHVDIARDGLEAWDQMSANRPDMVVTDLQMPRMNGLQLIQQMRIEDDFREIPVILLTAKGFELDHVDYIDRLGVFEIVAKPFSPRDLCKRVAMALGERHVLPTPVDAPLAPPALEFGGRNTSVATVPLSDLQDCGPSAIGHGDAGQRIPSESR